MAPHLARAQSARKDIGYAYFITHTHARTHARTHTHTHTHTHTKYMYYWWWLVQTEKTRQISMQKRRDGFSVLIKRRD